MVHVCKQLQRLSVLPILPVDTTISPVQLADVHKLQEQERSLRKKFWDSPKEFRNQTIEQVKVKIVFICLKN